jgi:RHS repeat-associated protein
LKRVDIILLFLVIFLLNSGASYSQTCSRVLQQSLLCSGGSSVSFTVTSGISYTWYENGSTLSNGGDYSINGNVLIISNPSGKIGRQYYCLVNIPSCSPPMGISNIVTLAYTGSVPSITSQPSNSTVCSGSQASFSVTASNATSYVWYSSVTGNNAIPNTMPWSGMSTSSLTVNPTSSGVAGQYWVKVTNACGTVTSNNATLTVEQPITVSNNGPVCIGNTLTLTGPSGKTSYSWTGPNGFSSSLQSPAVSSSATTAMSGTYYLTVTPSNSCGSSASTVAAVTYGELAGSSGHNYIRTRIPLIPYSNSLPEDPDPNNINTSFDYFDGLGRPVQKVLVRNSPLLRDIVTHIEYDEFGRQKRDYLPYPNEYILCNNGDFITNARSDLLDYYSSTFSDTMAYSEKVFDNSPLNRVFQQGSPGKYWQPFNSSVDGSGHTLKYNYSANGNYEVLIWKIAGDNLVNAGGVLYDSLYYYPVNTLYKTITRDENWTEGDDTLHCSEEYTDLQGRIVLRRSFITNGSGIDTLDTYYAYDDFGLLRYVLPPKASVSIASYSDTMQYSDNIIRGLCYYYLYDARFRIVMKQLPGAEPVFMVYDKRDRLVLSQDGNNRSSNKWIFTKYDALNRPVLTGVLTYPSSKTRSEMQSIVDNAYSGSSPRAWFVERNSSLTTTLGFTDVSFPNSSDGTLEYLSATYYDNYGFPGANQFDSAANISDYSDTLSNTHYYDLLKGYVTGSKVKVLSTSTYITTTSYYDDHYRVIESLKNLYDDANGSELTGSKYDFTGKVLQNRQKQTFGGSATTVDSYYTYDHAGRLIKTESEINGSNRLTVAQLSYNELGQLSQKSLHKYGSSFLQQIDYNYNIRGWLSKINDPGTLGSDLFAMQLLYENPSVLTNLTKENQYNGNISAMIWNRKTGPTSTLKSAYTFRYDEINRIKNNYYGEGSSLTNSNKFREYDYSYDFNGNILALKRNNTSGSTMDNLSYAYLSSMSNQLAAVTDNSSNASGFNDVNTTGNDYSYDNNGNLTKDLNKSFGAIRYNLLNLPQSVYKDASDSITYYYDAAGTKLKQVTLNSGNTSGRYYYDGFEYDNSKALSLIHFDEGIINDSSGVFKYEYFIKDHLGNTRITFRAGSNNSVLLTQSTDYYPFGLKFGSQYSNITGNKYLYNGKEVQNELGLDWYDYGARFYDSQITRFNSIDRLASDYPYKSPYDYAENRPVDGIDLDGLEWVSAGKGQGPVIDEIAKKEGLQLLPGFKTKNQSAEEQNQQVLQQAAELFPAGNTGTNGTISAVDPVQRYKDQLSAVSPVSYSDGAGLLPSLKAGFETIGFLEGGAGLAKTALRLTKVLSFGEKAVKGSTQAAEGIYEFTAASSKTYIGQSGNIPVRLEKHIASGKLLPGTSVRTTEVLGGKTAREIAEQLRINSLGGIYQNGTKVLENIRNPIGPARQYLLPKP